MSYASDERMALCALLDEIGPDAPTLCEGWRTADLAAHLVLRERRPDAAAGLLGGPLAGHTRRVNQALSTRTPFPHLVELIRTGPPPLSIYRLPGMDERLNLVEFFVHHEDVRRGADGWQPRELKDGLADALWQRLSASRLLFRRSPVGVELARDDLTSAPGKRQVRVTARARTPVVTVTGPPAELMLWSLGRTGAARVRLDGNADAVRQLSAARRGI
ncbi:MAG TPA: TIGR03085 family metal-binding protein [Candidatus Eisenbacteria bacterium]|nr:TIGR03085 family metal-binding protein [Candidatus Eisenbacteria bacterium]